MRFFFLLAVMCLLSTGVAMGREPEDPTAANLEEFFKKGRFSGVFRTFYMNRVFDKPIDKIQETNAFGGWLNYRSTSWNGFKLGLTGYAAEKLFIGKPGRDGAGLLAAGQTGYAILGQAFLQQQAGTTMFRIYRQELNTPFINPHDVRLIPKTMEACTWEGTVSKKLSFITSHVTAMKGWNAREFRSMSVYAGFPGTDEPVTLAGLNYRPAENCTLQAWNYVCWNFMNIVYFQGDLSWKMKSDHKMTLSLQTVDQGDIGRAMGGRFHTGMLGVKTAYQGPRGLVWLAYTSTADGANIRNPWGSYQGFTSIMEEDSDLASEQAWAAGLKYDFRNSRELGFTASLTHARCYKPKSGDLEYPHQLETDLDLKYYFGSSTNILLRRALVYRAHDMGNVDFTDIRVLLNISF